MIERAADGGVIDFLISCVLYTYMYVCMCIYIYIYTHTYIHTYNVYAHLWAETALLSICLVPACECKRHVAPAEAASFCRLQRGAEVAEGSQQRHDGIGHAQFASAHASGAGRLLQAEL